MRRARMACGYRGRLSPMRDFIELTDGTGGLLFYGATVDNQGGQISANGVGTHIDLYNADIIGGTLTTSDGGIIRVFGGDGPNTIDGTTSPATLTQSSNSRTNRVPRSQSSGRLSTTARSLTTAMTPIRRSRMS